MPTEIGEYVVGVCLRIIEECDVIDYNARPPGGGLEGLGELDVIGFNLKTQTVYLCEVTTHLDGLLIGQNAETTVETIRKKYKHQKGEKCIFCRDGVQSGVSSGQVRRIF